MFRRHLIAYRPRQGAPAQHPPLPAELASGDETEFVREVILPDWLPPREWIGRHVAWAMLWAMGADPYWPEATLRSLVALPRYQAWAAIRLMRTNPERMRSEFRRSLRNQVRDWLASHPDQRRTTPLSDRQLECLMLPNEVVRADHAINDLVYRLQHRLDTGWPVEEAVV